MSPRNGSKYFFQIECFDFKVNWPNFLTLVDSGCFSKKVYHVVLHHRWVNSLLVTRLPTSFSDGYVSRTTFWTFFNWPVSVSSCTLRWPNHLVDHDYIGSSNSYVYSWSDRNVVQDCGKNHAECVKNEDSYGTNYDNVVDWFVFGNGLCLQFAQSLVWNEHVWNGFFFDHRPVHGYGNWVNYHFFKVKPNAWYRNDRCHVHDSTVKVECYLHWPLSVLLSWICSKVKNFHPYNFSDGNVFCQKCSWVWRIYQSCFAVDNGFTSSPNFVFHNHYSFNEWQKHWPRSRQSQWPHSVRVSRWPFYLVVDAKDSRLTVIKKVNDSYRQEVHDHSRVNDWTVWPTFSEHFYRNFQQHSGCGTVLPVQVRPW